MKKDWTHEEWPAGTRVEVKDIHDEYLGEGKLLYAWGGRDCEGMPEIALDNGRILQGCECWWIPLMVVEDSSYK